MKFDDSQQKASRQPLKSTAKGEDDRPCDDEPMRPQWVSREGGRRDQEKLEFRDAFPALGRGKISRRNLGRRKRRIRRAGLGMTDRRTDSQNNASDNIHELTLGCQPNNPNT